MPFHFPLETVLRFRRSQERQQEILLQEANHRVTIVRQEVNRIEGSLATVISRLEFQLREGMTAAEIQFGHLTCSELIRLRKQLEKDLIAREQERAHSMKLFQQARRQREVVETLRRQKLQLHRQQENRQEQRRLDDQFLLRREFLRRS
jgi:flagellar export protein FliJ